LKLLLVCIENLERRCALLKWLALVAVLFTPAIAALREARSAAVPTTVDAQAFIVRDAAGAARAALGIGKDGRVGLEILDKTGAKRIILAVDGEGDADLAIMARDSSSVVLIDAGAAKASLSLLNGKEMGADITATDDQIALTFAEKKNTRRLSVGMDKHGDSSVILFGHTGEPRAILLDTAEQVGLSFVDDRKVVRAAMGVDLPLVGLGGRFVAFDKTGSASWQAP
jgi:hypothetical protein